MILTEKTINVLRNMAQLNGNILVQPGNVLKSVNDAQTVFSRATVEDEFPQEFGIYDLSEFLSIVSLAGKLETTDFDFSNDKYVAVKNGKTKVKYWFASPKVLRYPEKDIKMPPVAASFELNGEEFQKLKRAAQAFGHSTISFYCDAEKTGGEIVARAFDPEVDSSSTLEVSVAEKGVSTIDFNYIFSMSNLKYMSDSTSSFEVSLAAKGAAKIAQFDSGDFPISYFVAVDSASTISTEEDA